jgi:S-adenosylmethionine hydrolase
MADALITLTTDFGEGSPYVAAMKGVVLGINPTARLLDLGHGIPPQDLRHAAFFLLSTLPYFPPGVIHVVVVDPGVGGDRAILCVETGGLRLLVPDNGCWSVLDRDPERPPSVWRLAEPRYWRPAVSSTFHGRDVFAPVAAHLSLGVDPAALGPRVRSWVRLDMPQPRADGDSVSGEVVFVDHFGNLITNIPAEALGAPPGELRVGRHTFRRRFRWVRSYTEAEPGTLVALVSSAGLLEVAVAQGNAARRLRAAAGTRVTVRWKGSA